MQDLQSSVVLLLWMLFSGQGKTPTPCNVVQNSPVHLSETSPGICQIGTAEDRISTFEDTWDTGRIHIMGPDTFSSLMPNPVAMEHTFCPRK